MKTHRHHTATAWAAAAVLTGTLALGSGSGRAQNTFASPATGTTDYKPAPSFDLSSMNPGADPCQDFYRFACGNYAQNHPIPADETAASGFNNLRNVNTQELRGILEKEQAGGATRTPDEQKIGDYYHACMDTAAIEARDLKPIQPTLAEIDGMSLRSMPTVVGKLQREGITVLFSFGEQQDFRNASKQIASIDQGGLGLPEKDYYLRSGARDIQLRQDYVAHVTKMLTLAGATPQEALREANEILTFETALAKASQGVTERRDPDKVYHLVPVTDVSKYFPYGLWNQFLDAVHAPHVTELNDVSQDYLPAMVDLVRNTDIDPVRAYIRYQVLTSVASDLPARFDQENFAFYGKELTGAEVQRSRDKRCSEQVNDQLGEALGKVYVQQYFSAASKQKTLEMVGDIEHAMDRDLDSLDWMSPATKVRAKEKLHLVANKIGYPDHWRDYSALTVRPDDALGNLLRARQFENDRELAKIGKPVDPAEWDMTPPTVNAYYNPSMNDINFPAGILQPSFYDPRVDDAVNYGHIGAVIGHELTHGFDDQGKKFDGHGNLSDWWTPEDTKRFEAKTGCLVREYNGFVAVDDIHVNGQLTLGENTADNGGLLLAYMAYLDRAKKEGVDLNAKTDGYTAPQRFYIAFAQNWCSNVRPASIRRQVLTNEHSPSQFRADGPIVNQPGFTGAFGCKTGSPMTPADSCRVW